MSQSAKPVLLFTCQFDERTEFEVEQKGWFEQVAVRLPNGGVIPVCFWDPVRLGQDLESAREHGRNCFAEPGLIIVPRVNREYMESAVLQLFNEGYFSRLTEFWRTAGKGGEENGR